MWDALFYAGAFVPLGFSLVTWAGLRSRSALGALTLWLTAYAIALEGVPSREWPLPWRDGRCGGTPFWSAWPWARWAGPLRAR